MQEPKSPLPPQQRAAKATASSFTLERLGVLALILAAAAFMVMKALTPADTPFTQAVALVKANKAAAALPILEQLSVRHPDNPAVFPWLAQGYLSTDRVAEGRIALDTALRLGISGKDVAPAVMSYATYYERKGDFDEAEKLFQSANAICPTDMLNESRTQLYFEWAESDLRHNKLKEAVTHYQMANALRSNASEPLRSLIPRRLSEGLRQLAAVAQNQEKYDQAIALLEKSIEASDEPGTHMILADLYERVDKPQKAIEHYQIVAQQDKNNLEARHRIIDLSIAAEDYDKAQETLIELTDQEKSIENYQQLAFVDLKLNNYAGAVHALEDACDLGNKAELLKQLLSVLNDWSANLTKEKKMQEAISVKGHADRVAELLAQITKSERDAELAKGKDGFPRLGDKVPPVALVSSRTWLARGSVTPEGEIKIKNVSGRPLTDLMLTVVFYDNTDRKTNGSVTLPVVTPNSGAFASDDYRTLYFSCPTIVHTDHQLAVLLLWQGRFLREFPVAKEYGQHS
jgi:tetratricopeptide (TPR) repeat protein